MYYCQELVDNQCVQWVEYHQASLVDQLAITQSDMFLILGSMVSLLSLYVGYAFIARAVNLL